MLDSIGQEVVVGDVVAFNTPYVRHIIKGTVSRVNKKSVDVQWFGQHANKWQSKDTDLNERKNLRSGEFIVITQQLGK